VSVLYPSGNDWVVPIEARSLDAAEAMRAAVLRATGAADRGIVKRADLTGFNWSKVPSVLIEMGFMSNPIEDEMLATEAYQAKLADGITAGIVAYLEQ
jgi:N-acetylmuramoyl-L-alanine amidase